MKEYTKTCLFKLAKKDDSSLLNWLWYGQRYDYGDCDLLDINTLEVILLHNGKVIFMHSKEVISVQVWVDAWQSQSWMLDYAELDKDGMLNLTVIFRMVMWSQGQADNMFLPAYTFHSPSL